MLFVIKGETVFPETLRLVKDELKIPCVAYVWDCPFYSYSPNNPDVYRKNNFSGGMSLYDHIFVYDPYYVEEIQKKCSVQTSYLPLATDPQQYRRIDISEEDRSRFGFDVCFIGAPFNNRARILDSLSEFNLGVFGSGWGKWYWSRFRKPPEYYKGSASGEKALRIIGSSKIVLNIHDPEAVRGVNTRTFDILACGAFELVDLKEELPNLFKIGQEIVSYKNADELKELIKHYLRNPQERLEISERGKDKVLNYHTWFHRMTDMVDVLKEKGILVK